jgi:hypothetical protein
VDSQAQRDVFATFRRYLGQHLSLVRDMLCNFYRCKCLKMLIVDEMQEHMRKVPNTRIIRLKL